VGREHRDQHARRLNAHVPTRGDPARALHSSARVAQNARCAPAPRAVARAVGHEPRRHEEVNAIGRVDRTGTTGLLATLGFSPRVRVVARGNYIE
jgi:hypothetical protein